MKMHEEGHPLSTEDDGGQSITTTKNNHDSTANETWTFDDIFKSIGEFGRYQVSSHNSPIYNECQTRSAKVLTLL